MDVESSSINFYHDEQLTSIIKNHPYFKNPCKYNIRIISIMKYLKKKGLDAKEKDIDIRIDKLISSLENVEKIDFGLYKIIK